MSDSMDDICEFSDLPKPTCAHCRRQAPKVIVHDHAVGVSEKVAEVAELGQQDKPKFRRGPTTMHAEFDSDCPACSEPIEIGDEIVYSEEVDAWVHKEGC